MTPPAPRRERHRQDKETRIHEAALALFAEQGFEAATMRQIADRADVATGTLFRYAADKGDLLLAVFRRLLAATSDAALDPAALAAPLPELLPRLFDRFFDLYRPHRALARDFVRLVLFHAGPARDREWGEARAFVARLADLLRARQAAGEVRADVDPDLAAFALFGLYQAVLLPWLTGELEEDDARARLRALLALHADALRPDRTETNPT